MPRISKLSKVLADRTKPHHKGTMIVEGIPADTKDAFKSACALRGETMRDAIISFMREYAVFNRNPHL